MPAPTGSEERFKFNDKVITAAIEVELNRIANSLGAPESFKVEFLDILDSPCPPDLVTVQECLRNNCSVMAKIRLTPANGRQWGPVDIPFLYPYHGVFVTSRGNGTLDRPPNARMMVWRPLLLRRPGLWLLRERKQGSFKKYVELGLPAGGIWRPGEKGNPQKNTLYKPRRWVWPQSEIKTSLEAIQANYPSIYAKLTALREYSDSEPIMVQKSTLLKIDSSALEFSTDDDQAFHDMDHLETSRLYTYERFLAEEIVQLICSDWLDDSGKPHPDFWATITDPAVKKDKKTGGEKSSRPARIDGLRIWGRLRRKMTPKHGHVYLRPFECMNAVDAISSLTAFLRFGETKEARQNHPSFENLICPVQTPESEKVGLTLHLASRAQVSAAGHLASSPGEHGLGYAASLLPFYPHTDAARSMVGAKNLVQALPVRDAEPPLITTGGESALRLALKPLNEAGLLSLNGISVADESFFSPGRNLLVAYMPWYGLNYNDAIVANADLQDSLSYSRVQHFRKYLRPGTTVEILSRFTGAILALKNASIEAGDVIARLNDGKLETVLRSQVQGDVINVKYSQAEPPYGGVIEWTIETSTPLGAGDKLMGRHGNKGVISAMLPASRMPHLPVDDRLGVLSGRAVDLILNPLGVASRMNIGQLMESHAGLLHKLGVSDLPLDIGAPFKKFDADALRDHFRAINQGRDPLIDDFGRMQLTLTGEGDSTVVTEWPVVVGFQYIVRLDQIPSDTAHVRGVRLSENAYNPVTGQATKGRRSKGGMRLGSQEMKALDAYQASGLMDHFLTDSFKPMGSSDKTSQTYVAIRDMLFAMGIVLATDPGDKKTGCLRWATDQDVMDKCRELQYLPGTDALQPAMRGAFKCPECGECLDDGQVFEGSWLGQRSTEYDMRVEDILRHREVRLNDVKWGIQLKTRTCYRKVELPLSHDSTPIDVAYKLTDKGSLHVKFKIGVSKYHAYRHDSADPEEGVQIGLVELLNLPLTCIVHQNKKLEWTPHAEDKQSSSAKRPGRCVIQAFGGLADPSTFKNESCDWGYISLPFPIANPEVSPAALSVNTAIINAETCYGKGIKRPPLTKLPVLPWRYRKGITLADGPTIPYKLTTIYQSIAGSVLPGKSKELTKNVQKLFGNLRKQLQGKDGLIQYEGVGRRVNNSARFVVVPNPELAWDECELPLEALISLFDCRPHDLKQTLEKTDCVGFIDQADMVGEVLEWLNNYIWPVAIPKRLIKPIQEVVRQYLEKTKPLVLVNRQPSLHRYNVKALRPVIFKKPEPSLDDRLSNHGWNLALPLVLSVNPLICVSMGLDYDGDTISVFTVPSAIADEASKLIPSARGNLLSVATGAPVMEFDQDLVLGSYLISQDQALREEFTDRILQKDCPECIALSASPDWDADVCEKLLTHLCGNHSSDISCRVTSWMQMAFKVSTLKGVSFGFFDLLSCKPPAITELTEKWKNSPPSTDANDLAKCNDELNEEIERHLHGVIMRGSQEPGYSWATMVISKARGDKQARQFIGARGYLAPGDVRFQFNPADYFFVMSLVDGMDPHSSFLAAMNGRSSMVDKKLETGKAGGFAKRLAITLWNWRVKSGSCDQTPDSRSPATCKWGVDKCICSSCYDLLPDETIPPDGYPAGLIAAQSIGERGSQLALKVSHSGAREIEIDEIEKVLGEKDRFNLAAGPDSFLSCLNGKFKALENIEMRHRLLLWRVIAASDGHTINSAFKRETQANVFAGLVSSDLWRYISRAISNNYISDESSTLTKVIKGFPGKCELNPASSTATQTGSLVGLPVPSFVVPVGGIPLVATPGHLNAMLSTLRDADDDNNTSGDPNEDEPMPYDEDDEYEYALWADEEGERDIEPEETDDGPHDENDEPAGSGNKNKNTPTLDAISGIVSLVTGKGKLCRVEMPSQRQSGSNIVLLANSFCAHLATEYPQFLDGTDSPPPSLPDRKTLLERLKEHSPDLSSLTESNMSEFVKHAWLFLPDHCIPISRLFSRA